MSCVGLGLATPLIIDANQSEISLHTAAVIASTRDSFTLSSPVALPMLPSVTIESGTLSVASTTASDSMTGAAMLALLMDGKAKLVLNEATLLVAPNRKPDARPASPSGKPAGVGRNESMAPLLSALMKLSFAQLQLHDSSVRIEHADGSEETISKVSVEITQHNKGQTRAAGSLVFRNRPVSFDIIVTTQAQLTDDPAERGKTMIGRTLDIALKSDLLEVSAAGSLSAGEHPQYTTTRSEVIVSNVRDTARWLGLQLADGPGLGSFRAIGPLSWSTTTIAFPDATFELDGNRAIGTLALKLDGKRPAFEGTLDFRSFDAAPYLTAPKSAGATTSFDFSNYFTTANTGAFPLLDQLDADLRISADSVAVRSMLFGKGAASLSLKDGMLLADLAELELGKGARCGGQFGIQASDGTPRYTLRGKVESIDLAVLTNVLWSYAVLAGNGDVTVDLNARGHDRKSILSSVGGKASISQPASGQIGIDLRTLAATARAQMQKGWGGATRGQTSIDGLNAHFSLRNGQLSTERVGARAGDAALKAVGSVNLLDSVSDLKVWITHPAIDATASIAGPARPAKADTQALPSPSIAPPPASAASSIKAVEKPAEAKAPGGGLHFLGPLDAPEIRFVPLSERPAHELGPNAPPGHMPPAAAGSG